MTRRKKPNPPDNEYFHYYNNNPKDRHVDDCAYRALALFLDISWEEAAEMAWDYYLDKGLLLEEHDINKINEPGYLFSCGKMNIDYFLENELDCECIPRDDCHKHDKEGMWEPTTVREFIDLYAKKDEVYFASDSTHFFVIKNRKVWDTVDCSQMQPSHYYKKRKAKG